MMKKKLVGPYIHLAVSTEYRRVTEDGQTDGHCIVIVRAMHTRLVVKIISMTSLQERQFMFVYRI